MLSAAFHYLQILLIAVVCEKMQTRWEKWNWQKQAAASEYWSSFYGGEEMIIICVLTFQQQDV
jgi:hypothetical protein